MMCAADVCRLSLGGTVAKVGVSEVKTEQLRDGPTTKENRDHRNGTELKLEEETLEDRTTNKYNNQK